MTKNFIFFLGLVCAINATMHAVTQGIPNKKALAPVAREVSEEIPSPASVAPIVCEKVSAVPVILSQVALEADIDAVLDKALRIVTREDDEDSLRGTQPGAQQPSQASLLERQRQKELLSLQIQALKAEKNYYKAMTLLGGCLSVLALELGIYYLLLLRAD